MQIWMNLQLFGRFKTKIIAKIHIEWVLRNCLDLNKNLEEIDYPIFPVHFFEGLFWEGQMTCSIQKYIILFLYHYCFILIEIFY